MFHPLDHRVEGVWSDAYIATERVVEGTDGEEHQADGQGERRNHEHVRRRAPKIEEVSEAHNYHPAEEQYYPQDSWQTFLGLEQASPPGIPEIVDVLQFVVVEDYLSVRGGVEIFDANPDFIHDIPGFLTLLAIAH